MAEEKLKKRYHSVPISHMLNYSGENPPTTLEKLNIELGEVYEKVKLSDKEIEIRSKTFNKIKKIIEKECTCKVEAYGSFRTKMMVYDSDIDITVIVPQSEIANKHDDEKSHANSMLLEISRILEKSETAKGPIIHIKKARTPILKCMDRETGSKIDISVNKGDGIQAAEFILDQLALRPDMKYFLILLKHFLKRRRLSDTANGGLCAYAQFLMVLSFFQLHPLIQNENISIRKNLGVLFLDFFQFYGVDFPFEKTTISVKEQKYSPNKGSYINIEDPISADNNVAGGCTSIGIIKDLFAYSYKIMSAAISQKIDPRKSVVSLWIRSDSVKKAVNRYKR